MVICMWLSWLIFDFLFKRPSHPFFTSLPLPWASEWQNVKPTQWIPSGWLRLSPWTLVHLSCQMCLSTGRQHEDLSSGLVKVCRGGQTEEIAEQGAVLYWGLPVILSFSLFITARRLLMPVSRGYTCPSGVISHAAHHIWNKYTVLESPKPLTGIIQWDTL